MWIRLGRKKPKSLSSVLRGVEAYLRLLMAAGVVLSLVSPQARAVGGGAKPSGAAPLPVPCGGAACTRRGGPTQWLTSGSVDSPVTNGNTMSIHQNTQSAILNWASFDIANGYTVRFDQPNADAVALNKIFQGAPSKIFGNLIANGNVFLVNTNGILFGSGSQVNLHGLIASSLDIKDEVFNLGITNAINSSTHEAAFDSTKSIEDALAQFGDYKQVNAGITVEAGASISATSGGYVRLFGPDVTNRGTISAPDGVVMLAAGKQIYLYETTDPNMRGVFVDVGVGGTLSETGGGMVSNAASGVISAARGSITMQGSMVNQSGRMTATTTVNTNGSIRLIAADSAETAQVDGIYYGNSKQTGAVTLGAGSITEVLPELQDTTTSVAEQEFKPSYIKVLGHDITMESGSTMHAASGNVQLLAIDDPSRTAAPISTSSASDARVYLGAGSLIDVSGTTDTVLAMDHNALEVELRGVQLADAPLQRDGILSGQKVTIDVRTGSAVANVSGAIAGIGKNVGERTATGGTVSVESQGDVVTQAGSTIDVSGGKITYQGGYVNTTKLIGNDGKIYDIGTASPDRTYAGILGQYTQTNRKWGQIKTWSNAALRGAYQQGYTQGADAGAITIKAAGAVLDGSLLGHTEAGVLQRDPHRDPAHPKLDVFGSVLADPYSAPQGGQLVIGDSGAESKNASERDFLTPAIDIAAHSVPSSAADAPSQNGKTVHLGADALAQSGMARIDLYSNGKITVHDDVDLHVAPGGEIKLVGTQLDMQGGLHTPGGTIELKTKAIKSGLNPTDNNLQLGAHAQMDVHGLWVNDAPGVAGADTGVKNINGGKITVSSAGDVILPAGSVLDAGGGAWLQDNGKVKTGNGGSINIATVDTQAAHTLQLDAQLLGDAPGKGGSLSVTANAVRIDYANTPTPATPELLLTPEFFQRGGFSSYSVEANIGGLTIAPNTIIAPQAQTRVLDTAAKQQASGADMRAFSKLEALPDAQRQAVDLTFTSAASNPANSDAINTLHVAEGAQVKTEAGGTITLSGGKVLIDGALIAPGGAISVSGGGVPTDKGIEFGGIALGEHARLAATGAARYQPNTKGLLKGAVLDAGNVTLNAGGYVATATGSIIDVSAVAAPLDLPADAAGHVTRTTVSGKGGSVNITASEGMVLNGVIDAHAAKGQGAQGGALSLTLTRGSSIDPKNHPADYPTYPTAPREVVLQATDITPPPDVNPALGLSKAQNGQAIINVSSIDASGVTQFTARSDDAIRFDGNVNLHTERSVQLDAPVISASNGADVHVSSAYVALGNAQPLRQLTTTGNGNHAASGGAAKVQVNAQLLDLIGTHATQNIGTLELHSDGDLRLRGELIGSGQDAKLVGALNTVADLTVHADQIYPTTLTQFTINASKPDSTVTVVPGDSDHPVLSAAGTLTVNAPNIVQQGVLKAPFGQITLNAEKQLTLAAGSKTSVAGDGLTVPFGKTANGKEWIYDLGSTILTFDAPPEKRISLNGQDVDTHEGAQVDVSGGGDLYAYEFLPGPGGSRDVLLDPHSFAVLPGLQDGVAPVDYQYQFNTNNPVSGLQPGDRVYLSGVPGLQAGYYTLLPAHYALLDGAFLVKPVSGYQDMAPGQSVHLVDGTPVVAGYYDVANTSLRDARWSGFAVQPGGVARDASEFHDRSANTFFAQQALDNEQAVPRLPGDAGTLAIAVQHDLQLEGSLIGKHAYGTRGAQLDIAAENITVVDTPDASDSSAVQIRADKLANFGAESVLLGGTRKGEADGSTTVDVIAQNVRIADGVQMQGSEILLTARNEVTIGHDARVSAIGAPVVGSSDKLAFNGDSAMVRVSTHQQAQVARSSNTGAQGVVNIQSGAVLAATGSMTLDGTNDTRLDGSLKMTGGSLSLGASKIGIGAEQADKSGLHLSGAQIADLKVDELVLNSHSSIDLYGAQDITTNNLTLSAGAVISHDLTQDQTIGLHASTLTLANNDHVTVANSTDAPSGTLNITADTVQLGAGTLILDGAAHNVINATQHVVATDAGALKSSQDLIINTPRITGTRHADYTVQAAQALALNNLGGLAKPNTDELGARLNFIGQSVAVNTLVESHSGTVTVYADGIGSADLVTIGASGAVDVSGVTKTYGDVDVHSPGGMVTLSSAHGDVDLQTGGKINVSAPDTGAHAGELDVSAVEGALILNGTLTGTAAADQDQAVFHADAQSLGDFSQLNAALNSGGFTGEREFRQRAGDVTVGGVVAVVAHNVNIAADQGAIHVVRTTSAAGTAFAAVDASGVDGGHIELHAKNDVTLGDGATLDAHATASDDNGGDVVLATQVGQLDLQTGSTVDVRGGAKGEGGTLHLRAPHKGANDVNILQLASDIKGARATTVEAFKVVSAANGNVTTALQTVWKSELDSYMSAADPTIRTRFGKGGDASFHVTPGLEVQSDGDLTLANDWDFHAWRYGTTAQDAGVLTLRAGGNIKFNKSLSDGFSSAATNGTLRDGDSWSYRIVAGAERDAADPSAMQAQTALAAGSGDIVLAKNALVRTGTGSINIHAAHDVILSDQTAVIYTAGTNAAALNSFAVPKNAFYGTHGGNVSVYAQGDITAAPSNQFITDWLWRQGQLNKDGTVAKATSWWTRTDLFQEGIGALGGGDVDIRVGGNMDNVSVMLPTSGRLDVAVGGDPTAAQLDVQGGGNLTVRTGGDINGGVFYVGRGTGSLRAAGSIGKGSNPKATIASPLVIALGDARVNLEANGNVTVDAAVNPTLLPQGKTAYPGAPAAWSGKYSRTYFSTYSPHATLDVQSLRGDAVFRNDIREYLTVPGIGINAPNFVDSSGTQRYVATDWDAVELFPPIVQARALQGSIAVAGENILNMIPAPNGNLQLIAATDVKATVAITQFDSDPANIPSPSRPASEDNFSAAVKSQIDTSANSKLRATTLIHENDFEPIEIVARDGDVELFSLDVAKSAHVHAGRDIKQLTLHAQNIRATDVTVIEAGRDVTFPSIRGAGGELKDNSAEIEVAGPGQLYVEAGRNIDLGDSKGISTVAARNNRALPVHQGASITAVAGVAHAADYAGFIKRYLEDSSAYAEQLVRFMEARGLDTSVAAFKHLNLNDQRALLLDIFFNELRESGRAAAQASSKEYARGRSAIATLFPQAANAAADYHGDINLFFSRIYTVDGGDINLLVPSGLVNAGLASLPPGSPIKSPAEKGIVAQATGSVHAYTSGDFLVNQERVFTLQGGDILLWSDHGNIDAGRGAKSAISAPAPTYDPQPDGSVKVNFAGAVAGSGIRAIVTDPNVHPGNVDLIAPDGNVNAGDAGIGSAGNLTIAAQHVLGADNIQVGGVSSGVPVVDSGSFASSLSGVGNIANSVTKNTEQALDSVNKSDNAAPIADAALTFLDVEVLGYGDEKKDDKQTAP
ncbi:MAG: filamentous hemagglutinin family protein [Gammaproteobacteria bacterium]|nr:filamentous hemagglutinin family protein [Gammaproteobacteria bacterium]